jgi:hypothetical protein
VPDWRIHSEGMPFRIVVVAGNPPGMPTLLACLRTITDLLLTPYALSCGALAQSLPL